MCPGRAFSLPRSLRRCLRNVSGFCASEPSFIEHACRSESIREVYFLRNAESSAYNVPLLNECVLNM